MIDDRTARRLAWGVLMPGLDGVHVDDWLREPLAGGLASVCLFATNVPTMDAARGLTDELRELAPDLVVGIDEEGGDVTRLHVAEGSPVPGNAALGHLAARELAATGATTSAVELARRCGEVVGRDLAATGINLDLAPVLDVASEPRNPVIGTRSFGADPRVVADLGRATIDGLHAHGVGACAKHFPGHGDTVVDSHVGLPVVAADRELLQRRELEPFRAVAGQVDAVMTAHLLVPALGEGIASLSPWAYRLLRDLGFGGVIVTDALGMGAVCGDDIGVPVVQALAAGADLLCLDSPLQRDARATFHRAVTAIVAAVHDGVLDPAALERSAQRTRELARRRRPGDTSQAHPLAVDEVGDEVARQSVEVHGLVPGSTPIAFADLRRRTNIAAGANGQVLLTELRREFTSVTELTSRQLDALAAPGTSSDELRRSTTGRRLVVQVRSTLSDPQEAALLRALLDACPDAVVVHCGTADAAPDLPNLVLAHGVGRVNARAVARALAGGAA